MRTNGIPTREIDLLLWSAHLCARLCSQAARYGVDASLADQYRCAHAAFERAHDLAISTCTAASITAKNAARDRLIAAARSLVRQIQANPATTNVHRAELCLRVPKEKATRIGPPREAPNVNVIRAVDDTVRIELLKENDRCAKPRGVKGAVMYVFIGKEPPHKREEWSFAGNVTKARAEVDLPGVPIGQPIWLCAAWYNPRGEHGPTSHPTHTFMSYSQQRLAA